MFKVGDRVKFTNFESSGDGIGTIVHVSLNTPEAYPYKVFVKIESTSRGTPIQVNWYFPFSHITHEYTELKYDPNQMVSEEDDL